MAQDKSQRLNEQITAPQVRLIGAEGEQVGIVAVAEALRMADEAELDLMGVCYGV
ncbi:MAG: translation initiation factor IF-3, partial [Gammaproteobacteria bacterium]|nr:translation initiation factor IF-3 [Gammaproteobacteria bacterium]